ncbi:MAG: TRAM domain-containing protein, partial [Hyphomonadaceae bacterium]|nr:TRAM domain-containing protein [Hyphomonadaceae bacterium]
GFPGETEADFEATLALVEAVGFASAYSFKYSPRPGTPAAAMRKQVAEEVKTERLARLQALLSAQQRAFNDACVGRRISVLVSGPGRKPGQLAGRSPYLQAVHFEGPAALTGQEVAVLIESASQNSLSARIAPAEVAA